MEPDAGLINKALAVVGIEGPRWLVDPKWALMSVALVDVWKGVGLATVIYIAGIVSVPREYYDAATRRRRHARSSCSATSRCRSRGPRR